MVELLDLEEKIRQRLAAAEARRLEEQSSVRQHMEEVEQRTEHFSAVALELMDEIVRPRVRQLVTLFPNSHLSDREPQDGNWVVCSFDHTPQYPAGTKLEIGICADGSVENAILTYKLEILPVYFQFEGHDQLVVPLNSIDDTAVADWVDGKILEFVETYVKLQVIEQYQHENIVVDPVCGMRINRAIAIATVEHRGRTYYFCTEKCQRRFVEDPDQYAMTRG